MGNVKETLQSIKISLRQALEEAIPYYKEVEKYKRLKRIHKEVEIEAKRLENPFSTQKIKELTGVEKVVQVKAVSLDEILEKSGLPPVKVMEKRREYVELRTKLIRLTGKFNDFLGNANSIQLPKKEIEKYTRKIRQGLKKVMAEAHLLNDLEKLKETVLFMEKLEKKYIDYAYAAEKIYPRSRKKLDSFFKEVYCKH